MEIPCNSWRCRGERGQKFRRPRVRFFFFFKPRRTSRWLRWKCCWWRIFTDCSCRSRFILHMWMWWLTIWVRIYLWGWSWYSHQLADEANISNKLGDLSFDRQTFLILATCVGISFCILQLLHLFPSFFILKDVFNQLSSALFSSLLLHSVFGLNFCLFRFKLKMTLLFLQAPTFFAHTTRMPTNLLSAFSCHSKYIIICWKAWLGFSFYANQM